jgi:hypothetical protein
MSDAPNHFEKLAKLRELYPDEVDRINADEQHVSELLVAQEYLNQPLTQQLLALCRKDILAARKMLATTRSMTDEQRADAWHVIDARLWFVRMVAKDYAGELAQMEQELEAELSR